MLIIFYHVHVHRRFFHLFLSTNFASLRTRKKDLILFSFTHSHLAELVVNKFPAVLILRTCLLTSIQKIEGLWTGHPFSHFLWFWKGRRIFRYLLGLSSDPFTALTHCPSRLGSILSPGLLDERMSLTCDYCHLLLTTIYVFLSHLRFDYNQIFGGKISKHVEYSEFLNLRPYMTSPVRKRMCLSLNPKCQDLSLALAYEILHWMGELILVFWIDGHFTLYKMWSHMYFHFLLIPSRWCVFAGMSLRFQVAG